jgi:hypothetical protein
VLSCIISVCSERNDGAQRVSISGIHIIKLCNLCVNACKNFGLILLNRPAEHACFLYICWCGALVGDRGLQIRLRPRRDIAEADL